MLAVGISAMFAAPLFWALMRRSAEGLLSVATVTMCVVVLSTSFFAVQQPELSRATLESLIGLKPQDSQSDETPSENGVFVEQKIETPNSSTLENQEPRQEPSPGTNLTLLGQQPNASPPQQLPDYQALYVATLGGFDGDNNPPRLNDVYSAPRSSNQSRIVYVSQVFVWQPHLQCLSHGTFFVVSERTFRPEFTNKRGWTADELNALNANSNSSTFLAASRAEAERAFDGSVGNVVSRDGFYDVYQTLENALANHPKGLCRSTIHTDPVFYPLPVRAN